MNETLKNLYVYLLLHKNESLTDIDCMNNVEGVTSSNVMQLLTDLESKGKIEIDHGYVHPTITVI